MSDRGLSWQRWLPEDFASDQPAAAPVIAPCPPQEDDPRAHWQAELNTLRQQAEKNGYAQGFEQGRAAGEKQGYAEGFELGKAQGEAQGQESARERQERLTEQLEHVLLEFQQAIDSLRSAMPARLMQIALTAARQVIGQSTAIDCDALLKQIKQLMHEEILLNHQPTLWVHPVDLAALQTQLEELLSQRGWTLRADENLHRGGCRITTDDGELDATLAARWQMLCQLAQEEMQR